MGILSVSVDGRRSPTLYISLEININGGCGRCNIHVRNDREGG